MNKTTLTILLNPLELAIIKGVTPNLFAISKALSLSTEMNYQINIEIIIE
jgi:hypothetical protein